MMAETISGRVWFRIRTRVPRRLFKNPVIEPKKSALRQSGPSRGPSPDSQVVVPARESLPKIQSPDSLREARAIRRINPRTPRPMDRDLTGFGGPIRDGGAAIRDAPMSP